jgi:hypothetical protein
VEAVVRWSAKRRALLGLFVPVFAWLSWWSFTSVQKPSPEAGWLAAGGALAAVLFQVHAAVYRVTAGPTGISERSLWGTRFVAWGEVQKVEAIAQATDGGKIHRWAAEPEAAFHIIVHTRKGRVSVHRWMIGVDSFIEALREGGGGASYREMETSPLERNDPSVKPALRPSRFNAALNQVYDGLILFKLVVLFLPLSWLGGVMAAIEFHLVISGNPFVDGTIVAALPWALGFGVYMWVAEVRRKRFGPEYARPPLGAKDLIMTMASAMLGPALLYGFIPRVVVTKDPLNLVFIVMGGFLCWIPVAEVRKCLRQA